MKRLLILLLCLLPFSTIEAYSLIELPQIASFGRGTINDIAWHPDGSRFAVASGTGTWIYDTDFNVLQHVSETLTDTVTWNDDGQFLLAGTSLDCDFWQTPITAPAMVLHLDDCFGAYGDWSGTQFVYQSGDYALHVIDVATAQETVRIETESFTQGLHFSPDGRQILYIGIGELSLFDTSSGTTLAQYIHTNNPESESRFSFEDSALWDAEQIYVLCAENNYENNFLYACHWDMENNTITKGNEIDNTLYWQVTDIQFTSSTELIYISRSSAPWGNNLFWTRNNQENKSIPDITFGVDTVAYDLSADGTQVLVGTQDGHLIIYDTETSQTVNEAQPHIYPINDIAWHPDDGRLAIVGYGMYFSAEIWQFDNPMLSDTGVRIPMFITQNVEWSATENDSELIFNGYGYGTAVDIYNYGRFDGETYDNIEYSEGQSSSNHFYEDAPSEDDASGLIYDNDLNQILLDGTPILIFEEGAYVQDMDISPDDKWLIAYLRAPDFSFSVTIWNTDTWEIVVQHPIRYYDQFQGFHWSPDNQSVAYLENAYHFTPYVGIINMDNPSELTTIDYPGLVGGFMWSPDNRYMMLAGERLYFYDIETTELLAEIDANSRPVAWRDDGAYLATGNINGTVQIWDMRPMMNR